METLSPAGPSVPRTPPPHPRSPAATPPPSSGSVPRRPSRVARSSRKDYAESAGEHEDIDEEESEDERTARVLTDVANSVLPGIIMECDIPSRNTDSKMPILDMKVWMDSLTGDILFQHYEKPSSTHKIMLVNSAQSVSCI